MSSSKPSEILDLARDLPTTAADVAALRQARRRSMRLSPAEYLSFLESLPSPTPEELRARRGPRGEPFEL